MENQKLKQLRNKKNINKMKQYEYIVRETRRFTISEEELNQYGKDGWQLCGYSGFKRKSFTSQKPDEDCFEYVFMREKKKNTKKQNSNE